MKQLSFKTTFFLLLIELEKRIFRGCLSDADEIEARLLCGRANETGFGTCIKCSSDGCNNQPKFRNATLSCSNCMNSEECAFGQNSNKTVQCSKPVALGDKETCFTHSTHGSTIH